MLILAIAFDAPRTSLAEETRERLVPLAATTLKAVSVGSVFSVIGAATADTLF